MPFSIKTAFRLLMFFLVALAIPVTEVYADICFPLRTINQWACVPKAGTECAVGQLQGRCQYDGITVCPLGAGGEEQDSCVLEGGVYPEDRTCMAVCLGWVTSTTHCDTINKPVPCSPAPDCKYEGIITTCSGGGTFEGPCKEDTSILTYGCWVPGDSPTPTSVGAPTPTPGGFATPIPTPPCPPPYDCNLNTNCDMCENVSSCPQDCVDPLWNSGIRVRAVRTDSSDCSIISGLTTGYEDSTIVSLSGNVFPMSQTQSPSTHFAEWLSVPLDTTYTVGITSPANLVISQTCLYNTTKGTPPAQGTWSIPVNDNPGDSFSLYVSLRSSGTWSQTGGGNVHAYQSIASLVPFASPPYFFSENGLGGFPGLVTYEGALDVASGDADDGTGSPGSLSTKRWHAIPHFPAQSSFYAHFFTHLLGGDTTMDEPATDEVLSNDDVHNCGPSRDFCYFVGPLSTSDAISIDEADSPRIIVIDGNLTINHSVNIAAGEFLAFIVRGNIIIDPSVGSDSPESYISTPDPQIQGVYITDGTFNIGGGAPNSQLILRGMFIANSFLISRTLSPAENLLYPATMFVYDPSLLFTMPQILQEVPFQWQEVAP
jgi:hypothetical protein